MSTARSFNKSVLKVMFVLTGGAIGLFATAALLATHWLGTDFVAARVNQTLTRVERRVEQLTKDAVRLNQITQQRFATDQPLSPQFETVLAAKADAFELYQDISYLGIAAEATGEYAMLERTTNAGVILNREYPVLPDGSRAIRDYEIKGGRRAFKQLLSWDGYDPRQRPFYLAARQAGRPVWTDTYAFWPDDANGPSSGITYATPIFDSRSNLVGVVDVDFSLLSLSTFLRQDGEPAEGYSVIIEARRHGSPVIVAHPDPSLILDPQTKFFPTNAAGIRDMVIRAILPSIAGLGQDALPLHSIRVAGKTYYWRLRPLAGDEMPRWAVITLIPQSVMLREIRPMYVGLMTAAIILLLLSVLLAIRLAQRVSRPLSDLERQLGEQSEQAEPMPVVATGAEEILRLGTAFNRLIRRIKERRDELVEANHHLRAQNEQRHQAESALRETSRRIERQQMALVEHSTWQGLLAQNINRSFQMLTELSARTLTVERASLWLFTPDHQSLRCCDLYVRGGREHTNGMELQATAYPAYFNALAQDNTIAAHDAAVDSRTTEFAGNYFSKLGITSLLDVPIRTGGKLVGVLCLEQVGPLRVWHSDEEVFASAVANLTALALEVDEHKKTGLELERHRNHLEELVRDRTSELSRMNLLLASEVHERKRAEAELQAANERLQELDRLKSEFLATMSHELRTPLNSIIGFGGIIRQRLAGPVTAEQDKQLGMMLGSAKHLLGLINGLLDLSRIESGKMEIHRTWFQVAEVAENVIKTLEPLAAGKKLSLRWETNDPEVELYSDQKKVYQILLNLANNAVKFTDHGEVVIVIEANAQTVTIRVRDTGVGIKPEHMGTLFAAFRQVDGSARRVYEGTGLGLYLCKQLVEMLEGEISATSIFDQGSEFRFTLPVIPKQATGTTKP